LEVLADIVLRGQFDNFLGTVSKLVSCVALALSSDFVASTMEIAEIHGGAARGYH